ncbi:hypothetical protein [Bacillus canaveralius]|uniref:hypothetical protein n=1 Tax=Bacillus canaveralius TaxID=1403243 RepID=UPI0011573C23
MAASLFESIRRWSEVNGASWLQWNANPASSGFYNRLGFKSIPEEDEGFPFYELVFEEENH